MGSFKVTLSRYGLSLAASAGLVACGGGMAPKVAVTRQPSTTTTTAAPATTAAPTTSSSSLPPSTTTTLKLDPNGGGSWNEATTTVKECVNSHQPSNDGEDGILADVAGTLTNTGAAANDYVVSVSADVQGGYSQGTGNLSLSNVAPGTIRDWSLQIDVLNGPTGQLACSVLNVDTQPAS